jgi:DNA-damage-inducible protein D
MNDLDIFHFDETRQSFEDFGQTGTGGIRYWYATDLMRMLGYESLIAFQKAINKAISACTALNIPVIENFIQEQRTVDGKPQLEYRLSRFACYLTAMNGDVRKPQVAAAQAYFVTLAEAFRHYVQHPEDVERVLIREDVTEHEKSLSDIAQQAGVNDYGLFRNAGYRGLYNRDLAEVKSLKGVQENRTLLDFMGREELAANLFRITQTEAKIRNERIQGQEKLEATAESVGKTVRRTMIEISGNKPEDLLIAEDIRQVRNKLKKTHREFTKLDLPRLAFDKADRRR